MKKADCERYDLTVSSRANASNHLINYHHKYLFVFSKQSFQFDQHRKLVGELVVKCKQYIA